MDDSPASYLDSVAFIRANTQIATPPLVPEIRLHLATEVTPLWMATEATLERSNLPPPYWAFAWPGGQAVSRYLLDRPELVAGRTVLDFAAGSGLSAIAAVRAGAARVTAAEIDRFALVAIGLNTVLNQVTVALAERDVIGTELPAGSLFVAGDVCYEQPMSGRLTVWLRALAATGVMVVIGDPGRAYLPKDGLEQLAHYKVPTSLDLEDRTTRETTVWRVLP
ncbi:ETFB lysine methyltransferase [uncultured Gammaproteobacteria bacterium]